MNFRVFFESKKECAIKKNISWLKSRVQWSFENEKISNERGIFEFSFQISIQSENKELAFIKALAICSNIGHGFMIIPDIEVGDKKAKSLSFSAIFSENISLKGIKTVFVDFTN